MPDYLVYLERIKRELTQVALGTMLEIAAESWITLLQVISEIVGRK
jgi:hypothetical protein